MANKTTQEQDFSQVANAGKKVKQGVKKAKKTAKKTKKAVKRAANVIKFLIATPIGHIILIIGGFFLLFLFVFMVVLSLLPGTTSSPDIHGPKSDKTVGEDSKYSSMNNSDMGDTVVNAYVTQENVFAQSITGAGQDYEGDQSVNSDSGSVAGGTNSEQVNKAIKYMVNLCEDESHGYSQSKRNGPDYDCSSSVYHSYVDGGGLAPNLVGSNTGAWDGIIRQLGSPWIKMKIDANYTPCPGDILYRAGHVEMYIGAYNGKFGDIKSAKAGFHSAYGHPETGDQTGKESSVTSFDKNKTSFTDAIRLKGTNNSDTKKAVEDKFGNVEETSKKINNGVKSFITFPVTIGSNIKNAIVPETDAEKKYEEKKKSDYRIVDKDYYTKILDQNLPGWRTSKDLTNDQILDVCKKARQQDIEKRIKDGAKDGNKEVYVSQDCDGYFIVSCFAVSLGQYCENPFESFSILGFLESTGAKLTAVLVNFLNPESNEQDVKATMPALAVDCKQENLMTIADSTLKDNGLPTNVFTDTKLNGPVKVENKTYYTERSDVKEYWEKTSVRKFSQTPSKIVTLAKYPPKFAGIKKPKENKSMVYSEDNIEKPERGGNVNVFEDKGTEIVEPKKDNLQIKDSFFKPIKRSVFYGFFFSHAAGNDDDLDSSSPDGLAIGSNNAEKAWNFFRSSGYSAEASVGILGNLYGESNIVPSVTNSIGASGIAQWYRDRNTAMRSYITGTLKKPTWMDLEGQLKFIKYELETKYKSVNRELKSSRNGDSGVKDATWAYVAHYEVPATTKSTSADNITSGDKLYPYYIKRLGYARKYYSMYKDKKVKTKDDDNKSKDSSKSSSKDSNSKSNNKGAKTQSSKKNISKNSTASLPAIGTLNNPAGNNSLTPGNNLNSFGTSTLAPNNQLNTKSNSKSSKGKNNDNKKSNKGKNNNSKKNNKNKNDKNKDSKDKDKDSKDKDKDSKDTVILANGEERSKYIQNPILKALHMSVVNGNTVAQAPYGTYDIASTTGDPEENSQGTKTYDEVVNAIREFLKYYLFEHGYEPNSSESDDSANADGYVWMYDEKKYGKQCKTITSHFGYRSSSSTNGVGSTNHQGLDIAWGGNLGAEIRAPKAGTVTVAGHADGFGDAVEIDHGDGISTLYGHLYPKDLKCSVGDKVKQKQVIALTGNNGKSTGPHLHFGAMHNDQKGFNKFNNFFDPLELFTTDQVPEGKNKGTSSKGSTGNHKTENPGDKLDFICAVVAAECNSSYDGALAVISCVMNRVDSGKWGGRDAVSVLTAPGQFAAYFNGPYKKYLGGKYPAHVKKAVMDCMDRGIRNHPYQSFRSGSTYGVWNCGGNSYK